MRERDGRSGGQGEGPSQCASRARRMPFPHEAVGADMCSKTGGGELLIERAMAQANDEDRYTSYGDRGDADAR
jgi:hypothetical protein